MIPSELTEFVEGGRSLLVGTRDEHLRPEAVRAVGVRVEAGGREVVLFVPRAVGARTVANARANGRLALVVCRIADHKTIQLKGAVLDVRDADEADRAWIDRWRAGFAEAIAYVGLPPRLSRRIDHWPAHALRVRVESVFVQTPGPGAGEPLQPGAASAVAAESAP